MNIILDDFDKTKEAMINPGLILKKVNNFPKKAIGTFSIELIKKFVTENKLEKIYSCDVINGDFPVYKKTFNKEEVALFLVPMGAASATIIVEELIFQGVAEMIIFGSCGVLSNKTAGKLIIPTEAIRDEGVSYHYAPASESIKLQDKAIKKIIKEFDNQKIDYITGKVWTTDALFRETVKKTDKRKEQGCIAVDMECASLTAVAEFRNVTFSQFLYSTDSLEGVKWKPKIFERTPLTEKELYLDIALKVITGI